MGENDLEPAIYPRCSQWFLGHLTPSEMNNWQNHLQNNIQSCDNNLDTIWHTLVALKEQVEFLENVNVEKTTRIVDLKNTLKDTEEHYCWTLTLRETSTTSMHS